MRKVLTNIPNRFETISPLDFENFVRDILQERDGLLFESFADGPDGGIDFRNIDDAGKRTFLQCKHYKKSSFSSLLHSLKKSSLNEQLNEKDRYIIATSFDLTKVNKEKIISSIPNCSIKTSDIIGKKDLENLTNKYPNIEGRYFALWLSNPKIFERILNKEVLSRSDDLLREIYKDSKWFVATEHYTKCLAALDTSGFTIISGQPGVGKTTIANAAVLAHVEQGYEFIDINSSVSEARRLFDDKTKQIFLFDDFLGATYLGDDAALVSSNQDKALIGFLNKISRSSQHRLILTTREHILRRSQEISERMSRRFEFDDDKILIEIEELSFTEKALILYNHLFYRCDSSEIIETICSGQLFLEIAVHENYNPRIIEGLTNSNLLHSNTHDLRRTIITSLENPKNLWKHAFRQQLSEASRVLIWAVYVSEQSTSTLESIKNYFEILAKSNEKLSSSPARSEIFETALKEVDGSFLKCRNNFEQFQIRFANPSIVDFLNDLVANSSGTAQWLFENISTFRLLDKYCEISRLRSDSEVNKFVRQFLSENTADFIKILPKPKSTDYDELMRPMFQFLNILHVFCTEEIMDIWEKYFSKITRSQKKLPDLFFIGDNLEPVFSLIEETPLTNKILSCPEDEWHFEKNEIELERHVAKFDSFLEYIVTVTKNSVPSLDEIAALAYWADQDAGKWHNRFTDLAKELTENYDLRYLEDELENLVYESEFSDFEDNISQIESYTGADCTEIRSIFEIYAENAEEDRNDQREEIFKKISKRSKTISSTEGDEIERIFSSLKSRLN